jgi:hypothetical protein
MDARKIFDLVFPVVNLCMLIVFAYLVLTVGTQCADCDRYCMDMLGINYHGNFSNYSWWENVSLASSSYNG